MSIDTMKPTRPCLRAVGPSRRGGARRVTLPLSDSLGEDWLLEQLDALAVRLDESGDLRYEVCLLKARFEQRLARRETS
jgi:hypothetical protein